MPEFAYLAVDRTGREVRGRMEAQRDLEVKERLRHDGLYPVDIRQGDTVRDRSAGKKRWKRADLVVVTMQLAHLIDAGMPVDRALRTLTNQSRKAVVKARLAEVLESVRVGQPLALAMEQQGSLFPPLYIQMVRAGEASGRLEEVLANLARYLESEARRWSQVRGMLTYPLFVVMMAAVALVIVMTVIMPQVEQVFAEFSQALPWSTQILLGASHWFAKYWPWLAVATVFAGLGGWLLFRTATWRLAWDRLKLSLPVLGEVTRKLATARMTRTLGVLLQGGVPMLEALAICEGASGNRLVGEWVKRAANQVREGIRLADSLGGGPIPPMAVEMIALGEETGRLETELTKVAETYDFETDASLKSLTALIEPAIIACIGLVLGFIIISVIGPIFNLNAGI